MKENKNTITYFAITVAVIAAILGTYFYLENKKNKVRIAELEKEVEDNETLDNDIKQKLKYIIETNTDIDPSISFELGEIAKLIEYKHETKAVLAMAKIIENLLHELYKNDKDLKEKVKSKNRKSATFDDYLDHAQLKGIVSKEDFHLLSAMKIMRNKEAHELAVKQKNDTAKIMGSFLVGFTTILSLWKLVKKNKALENA